MASADTGALGTGSVGRDAVAPGSTIAVLLSAGT